MKLTKSLIGAIVLFLIFNIACDKYNIVEPRFFSNQDLIDTPWYDSTYTSILFTIQIPAFTDVKSYIIGQAGNLIKDKDFESGWLPENFNYCVLWYLDDNDSNFVDDGIYAFVVQKQRYDEDWNKIGDEVIETYWFELKRIIKQEFGLNLISSYEIDYYAISMIISDNLACILYLNFEGSYNYGLHIVNVEQPSNPEFIASMILEGNLQAEVIKIYGNFIVLLLNNKLGFIDISQPSSPVLATSISLGRNPKNFCLRDNYAYVVKEDSMAMEIIDITNPYDPQIIGTYVTDSRHLAGISIQGNYIYLRSRLTNPIEGMEIIDISEPANPVFIARYDSAGTIYAIEFIDNYAYLNSSKYRFAVFNFSDPANPVFVKQIYYPYDNFCYFNRYVYLSNCSYNGDLKYLYELDVDSPLQPELTGCLKIYTPVIFADSEYIYVIEKKYMNDQNDLLKILQ